MFYFYFYTEVGWKQCSQAKSRASSSTN